MKLVQASLLGFAVVTSAWGQRGGSGGHAGFAHSGGGFSSGRSFSVSAPSAPSRAFGSAPAYRPNFATPQRSLYSSPIGPPPFGGTQPYGGRTNRYPYGGYRPYYYNRGVYLGPGFLNYGYGGYGYPDDSYYGDQQQSAAPDANAQAQAPEYEYGPPPGSEEAYAGAPPRPPYQPQAAASPDLQDQPEVTLLFKDGRPPQQVQNYAVTRTTLYVLDGARRREIPLDQLDLPQTEKTNRDAGVDFEIPAGAE